MSAKNDKQLVILIYVISIATLILIITLGILAILDRQQIMSIKRDINNLQNSIVIPKDGKNGKNGQDGYTPVLGKDYFNGINGTDGKDSTSTNTTIIKEVPLPGEKGDKGDTGPKLEIRVDPDSCLLMTRYTGDDLWDVQAQLPKPCGVL